MYKERVDTCANRITKALSIRKMKQADLCSRAKIPKSSLSQYLKGDYEPKQDRLHLIALALNVSEAWLMGYDVPMERKDRPSPESIELSEGEKVLLDLFRRVPEESQKIVLQMIRAALGSREQ